MTARRVGAWLTACFLALAWPLASATAQEGGAGSTRALGVEFVLDASGSMAEPIAGGETRMDAARRVLRGVVEAIPEEQGVNVGFRVFGQEGDNSEATRDLSCNASRLLVEVDRVRKEPLLAAVDGARPTGWSPIALALQRAADDFPAGGAAATNAVVLVTDGTETCDGDPCAVAGRLHREAGLGLVTHVIGFATTPEDQDRLACIAGEGGGRLHGADDADGLRAALFAVLDTLGRKPASGPTIGIADIPGTEAGAIRAFEAAEFREEGALFLSFAVVRYTDEPAARAGVRAIRARMVAYFDRLGDISGLRPVAPGGWSYETLALAGKIRLTGDLQPTDPGDPAAIPIALLIVRDGPVVHGMLGVGLTGEPLTDLAAIAERVVGRGPDRAVAAPDAEGLRTGGLWDLLPRPADLPEGFVLSEEFVPQL